MKSGYTSFIGRPNAGKSTLLNRIIGTKVAIVSDKPQTTRNRILAVKNYDDGQIVFVDTPGIHRPLHRLNVRMVDAAVETLREVDLVTLVFDASTRPGHGDEFVSNLLQDLKVPAVLVLNKIDLVGKAKLLPLMEEVQKWHEFAAIVPVSAATGDGVERLEQVMLEQMPEGEPGFPADYLTDQPERTIVSETVREKVLQNTRAELPFSTAVVVDEFDETERDRILRPLLHDLRRDRFAEADRHRPRRRDDQADRHPGANGPRAVLRHEGVPRSAREGQRRVAGQRSRARRYRRAEIRRQDTHLPPAEGLEETAWPRKAGPLQIVARTFHRPGTRQSSGTFGPARLNTRCGRRILHRMSPEPPSDTAADDELLQRIAAGDAGAFTTLFRRRQPLVYRFALHVTGAPTVAEDVTQEVFLAVMGDAARYQAGRATAVAWLCGIARNQAWQRLERDRRLVALVEDDEGEQETGPVDTAPHPLEAITRAEEVEALHRALLTLPVPYREAIALCDLQELNYVDAAAALDCAVGTLRSRLHRGRALLAAKMRPDPPSGKPVTRCLA